MTEQEPGKRCETGCNKCLAWLGLAQDGDAPKGKLLVFLAAAAFISPLIHAVIGAMVLPMLWAAPASTAVGALGGFAVGLADSWVATRIVRRMSKKQV